MKNEVKGTTRVCGLIGNPVHHTVSPDIHNSLADNCGIDLVYVPFEVGKGTLSEAIKGAYALNVLGLNVTIPYKSDVIPLLQDIDETAKQIGAVNTLVRISGGEGFKGYNTDYYGIEKTLENGEVSLEGASVVILGAGGVARPAAFLCANKGAKEVFILNRTLSKAVELSDAVNAYAGKELCKAMELNAYKELKADRKYLCFQMTSIGLYPDNGSAVIEDQEFYKLIDAGFDAVYRPLKTKFLRLCEQAGSKTLDGLNILLYQGVKAFELWNDTSVSEDYCRQLYGRLLASVLQNENIVLTGFMGCGKSRISDKLAKILGYKRLDVDALIEEEQGTSISSIFETKGEEYFRDLETKMMKKLIASGEKKIALAVGGGLPLREENRKLMREFGKVVCLNATAETVYDRVKNDNSRPLLQTENVMDKIIKLQEERRPVYEKAAHILVDTDKKKPADIAMEIIADISALPLD